MKLTDYQVKELDYEMDKIIEFLDTEKDMISEEDQDNLLIRMYDIQHMINNHVHACRKETFRLIKDE